MIRKKQITKTLYTCTLTKELKFKVNVECLGESVFVLSGFSLNLPEIESLEWEDISLSSTNLTLEYFHNLNRLYQPFRLDNGEFDRI